MGRRQGTAVAVATAAPPPPRLSLHFSFLSFFFYLFVTYLFHFIFCNGRSSLCQLGNAATLGLRCHFSGRPALAAHFLSGRWVVSTTSAISLPLLQLLATSQLQLAATYGYNQELNWNKTLAPPAYLLPLPSALIRCSSLNQPITLQETAAL